MATTLATIYAALRDLALTGVTSLTVPDPGLDTATIPCKWVDSIAITEEPLRRGLMGGQRAFRARLVVVTDLNGQDIRANRWTDALAMVDTLNTGIKTLSSTLGYTANWTIEVDPMFAGGGAFAVVATISASEWSS